MHVLIDGIVFENKSQIGIWRVFYEIMRRTSRDLNYTLLLANQPQQEIPDGVDVKFAFHRAHLKPYHLVGRANRIVGMRRSNRQDADAIWHPSYFSLDPRPDEKSVVTVYDMIVEKFFHLENQSCSAETAMKFRSLDRADEILAISNATAEDVGRFYPSLKQRISVMPMGFEHIQVAEASPKVQSPEPFALFVGKRSSYKNFAVLLQSLKSPNWPKRLKLRVAGSPFSEMETALIRYYSISEKIENVGRVSDSELAEMYQNSACFIFPSLAEGFGIPVLESQANACVPLLSDTTIFREVAGEEGAIYFNPSDPESICHAARQALDLKSRSAVLEAAKTNLTRFSWDEAAQRVVECYLRVQNR